jgi:hypothetical protein
MLFLILKYLHYLGIHTQLIRFPFPSVSHSRSVSRPPPFPILVMLRNWIECPDRLDLMFVSALLGSFVVN